MLSRLCLGASLLSVGCAGRVYGKGPFLHAPLRKSPGDDAFFAGLREYATQYRFRTAPLHGPVDSFARGAQRERVAAIAKRWLDDKRGDRDLGPIDLGAMLTTTLGADAAKLAPQVEGIFGLLNGGQSPAGGGGQGMTPADAQRIFEGVEKLIEGL